MPVLVTGLMTGASLRIYIGVTLAAHQIHSRHKLCQKPFHPRRDCVMGRNEGAGKCRNGGAAR